MKKIFLLFITLLFFSPFLQTANGIFNPTHNIVTHVKKINIADYPNAYNPSIITFNDGYLLSFRYLPQRHTHPWISHIYIVALNKSFEVISPVTKINTRSVYKITPSQAEDARLFTYKRKIYLIYNDNMDIISPSICDRRDMYIIGLNTNANHQFTVSDPIKLFHETDYFNFLWQKNWSPFEWKENLLITYTINPKEIICPDLETGHCKSCYETQKAIHWPLGPLRGGTPALLIEGEYWAFFHSIIYAGSPCSNNTQLWHYFMGAYAFSAEPPFEITKISPSPLCHPEFYTHSTYDKRVIYPGGFVIQDRNLYIAYGKDDSEIWIATIDFDELKKSMILETAVQ